ncbi:MAG: hypothetical protein ACTSW1_09745 [Candidatus Hodarchaeales archaeon]
MKQKIDEREILVKSHEMKFELERVLFEFQEEKIQVKFKEDFSGFDFGGISIPPIVSGGQELIPYYIADFFYEKGLIEDFRENFPTGVQDVANSLRSELRTGELQKVDQFFYIMMRELLLENERKESQLNELELKRIKSSFQKLTAERVSKLIKMTERRDINIQKSNFTNSERILFKQILLLLISWKENFLKQPR